MKGIHADQYRYTCRYRLLYMQILTRMHADTD